MPKRHTTIEHAHPYCEEYFRWISEEETRRIAKYEVADADIESAEQFYNACIDGPPPNETPPAISLLEFEDIFSGEFVY